MADQRRAPAQINTIVSSTRGTAFQEAKNEKHKARVRHLAAEPKSPEEKMATFKYIAASGILMRMENKERRAREKRKKK
jgi:hypothetical protein